MTCAVTYAVTGSDEDVIVQAHSGDALLAGLVHASLQHWALIAALDFAMACAELTLASPRANHPDLSLAASQSAS